MADFIEMGTHPTGRFMTGLAGAAETFGSAWAGNRGDIAAAEAGIGGDVLAQAFVAGYRRRAEPVVAATDRVPEVYLGLSAAGQASVATYRAADESGAGAIAGATAGAPGAPVEA